MAGAPSPSARDTLAVTLGDPRGIGPDVAWRAVAALLAEDPDVAFLLFGAGPAPERFRDHPRVAFESVGAWDGSDSGAGESAGRALEAAVAEALRGRTGAVVTGPVHKPSLQRAGWAFPGQTEMLQDLCGATEVGMLMCAERTRSGGALRVLLATTHLALRDVPAALTTGRLEAQTRLLDESLRRLWGLERPRIALCALNPHASDDGLFGDEEERVLSPAVGRLRADGIDVTGPVPADTVFTRALRGEFDAVVAPYHDVGMAAFKTASFGTGVNVTIGLPFVRTSPDHGTAFDLAARPGAADAGSMLEALRLGRSLAERAFDTASRDV